jgi:hypothetical protein
LKPTAGLRTPDDYATRPLATNEEEQILFFWVQYDFICVAELG